MLLIFLLVYETLLGIRDIRESAIPKENPFEYLNLLQNFIDEGRKESGDTWSLYFNKTEDRSYYDQNWNLIERYEVVVDHICVSKKQGLEMLRSMDKALYIEKDIGWGRGRRIYK